MSGIRELLPSSPCVFTPLIHGRTVPRQKRPGCLFSSPPSNLKYVTRFVSTCEDPGHCHFALWISLILSGGGLARFLWRNRCLWVSAAFARLKMQSTTVHPRNQTITSISGPIAKIHIISSWFCIVQFSGYTKNNLLKRNVL